MLMVTPPTCCSGTVGISVETQKESPMKHAILPLLILSAALAGCTRYRDGTVVWHTLGGPPGERSDAAHALLNEHGAVSRGPGSGMEFDSKLFPTPQDRAEQLAMAEYERAAK
jgi:hypothetical protein